MSIAKLKRGLGLIWRRQFLTSFLMGLTAGVPLVILGTLVQAWMTRADVDVKIIGGLAGAALPYSLKFLWAPFLDYYRPFILGRRRFWILLSQLGVFSGLWWLSISDPTDAFSLFYINFFICTCAATQDVVIDAYRREDLEETEFAFGSACYQWGYRLGTTLAGGGALLISPYVAWPWLFRLVSFLMLLGPLTLLFSPEPKVDAPAQRVHFSEVVIGPLREFFGRAHPWVILLFIFFYKFGDQFASSLQTKFLLSITYTEQEIGAIAKLAGLGATMAGVGLGALCTMRYGLRFALYFLGAMQMISTFGFTLLYFLPHSLWSLGSVIAYENISAGAGSAAFVAFMTSMTNRQFSATQYALLSALMSLPRTLLSMPAGLVMASLGWPWFYALGGFLALPGFYFIYMLSDFGLLELKSPVRKD